MKGKKILSMLLVGVTALGLLAGCGSTADDTQNSNTASDTHEDSAADNAAELSRSGNVLVVYYSATGNTREVANYIAEATDGDLFELEPTEPYTDDDLDWTDDNSRVTREHEDESLRNVETGIHDSGKLGIL